MTTRIALVAVMASTNPNRLRFDLRSPAGRSPSQSLISLSETTWVTERS